MGLAPWLPRNKGQKEDLNEGCGRQCGVLALQPQLSHWEIGDNKRNRRRGEKRFK